MSRRDPLLIRALVAAYPPSWRQKYGDEFGALLAEMLAPAPWTRRPAMIANALRGVIDARLRPQGGNTMPSRSPLAPVSWAAGLFTAAGIAFQKLTEDQPPIAPNALVGGAFDLLLGSATLALLALVVAATPTAIAMAKGQTFGAVPFLFVPPLAVAAWYGLVRIALLIANGHPVHSGQNIAAAALVVGGGIAVLGVTAWAASSVFRRVGAEPARWQPTVMTALTLGMGVSTLACLGWGLALRAANPGGFAVRTGLLSTPLAPSWILTILAMASATALAARTIRRPTAALRS